MPKAAETKTVATEETNIQEQAVPALTPEQVIALLQRISQLEQAVVAKTITPEPQVEEQPKNIVNEVMAPLQKPKRVKYKLSAYEADDAMIGGYHVPGKKLMGPFLFTSEIAMDQHGNYRTCFELDKLEMQTGMTGQELANFQSEVKIAAQYIERVTGENTSCRNHKFWEGKGLLIDNTTLDYDTSNVDHLINYYNILGGAFPEVARNRDEAIAKNKLIYLDIAEQEVKNKMSITMLRMEASAMLKEINDTWKAKDILFLIYALSTKKNIGLSADMPREILINELSEYIEGVDTQTEKKKRPKQFIDAVEQMKSPSEGDRIRALGLLNAALYFGFAKVHSKSKEISSKDSGNVFGTNIRNAVEYLINPVNAEDFSYLLREVTRKWID